jgi:hypothetical protein
MGFFQKLEDFVFGKPVTCHDELFGTLEFDRPNSTWNSLKPVAIGTDDAFVAINAGPEGPTDEQRQRFRSFASRWPDLKLEIGPLAYEELNGWFDGSREWYTKCNDAASLAKIPHLTAEGQVWDYLERVHLGSSAIWAGSIS